MAPLIKKGSNNKWVRVAKYLIGYSSPGKATTSFDASFKKSVVNWQKKNGLEADGEIGPMTWTKIAKLAATPSSTNKTATYAFQIAYGLGINGSYNSATQNAIKTLQKAAGLKVDGVCGASTWVELIALTPKKHRHTINYKQNDPKWGKIIYSKTGKATGQTIANSGCCPTSVASVLYTLKDKKITPVEMAKLAVEKGYRRQSGGTDGKFIEYACLKYGCRAVIETSNPVLFKHCLDKGGFVICAFKAGSWWTSVGHYSPCWSYDDKYYYVDNTISKLKIKREISKLFKDCGRVYCIYP